MPTLQNLIGNTDIYLIDQILKGRYQQGEKILDAGCGTGRNMSWFYHSGIEIHGIDANAETIAYAQAIYPNIRDNFQVSSVEQMPFQDGTFHHIICSAVLHFARDESHFRAMFKELVRVLRVGGSLFIRMTTLVGVENTAQHLQNGVYYLKDESHRFLLTRELLEEVLQEHALTLVGHFKTTLVEDLRSMATIVLKKQIKT